MSAQIDSLLVSWGLSCDKNGQVVTQTPREEGTVLIESEFPYIFVPLAHEKSRCCVCYRSIVYTPVQSHITSCDDHPSMTNGLDRCEACVDHRILKLEREYRDILNVCDDRYHAFCNMGCANDASCDTALPLFSFALRALVIILDSSLKYAEQLMLLEEQQVVAATGIQNFMGAGIGQALEWAMAKSVELLNTCTAVDCEELEGFDPSVLHPVLMTLVTDYQMKMDRLVMNSPHFKQPDSKKQFVVNGFNTIVASACESFFALLTTAPALHQLAAIALSSGIDVRFDGQRRGFGLYSITSKLTHSCVPNCRIHFNGDNSAMVISTRAIRVDEPLTLNYVDLYAGVEFNQGYEQRQWLLNARYRKFCHCQACNAELILSSPERDAKRGSVNDNRTAKRSRPD